MALTLTRRHAQVHIYTQLSEINLATISSPPVLIQSDILALGIHVSSSLSHLLLLTLVWRREDENQRMRTSGWIRQESTRKAMQHKPKRKKIEGS